MPLEPPIITEHSAAHERYQVKLTPGSSHAWALAHLASLSPTAEVLDIGSGSGLAGKYLQERGIRAIDSVEIDEPAIQATGQYYRRMERSIEALAGSTYDVILLLDILEHLVDPATFLTHATTYLRPGGRVLISVPNIAHWSVRIPLLFGSFNYTERGILDKTHLHFFTKSSLHRMVRKIQHLKIIEAAVSISPAEFVLPQWLVATSLFRAFSAARLSCANAWPALGAYQHLVVVERIS